MTIEELLKLAQSACWLMDTEMARDGGTLDRAAQYGVIAQGYAQTAQAMIMNAQAQDIAANNERAELQELWRQ